MLTAPEQATEHLGGFLQAIASAFFDRIDELSMDLVQHGLRMFALRFRLRAKGVQKPLVFTCGHQAALNAQLVHQAGETKAIHQDADAAHNTGFVDINFVGRCSNVISGRSAGLFDHRINWLFVNLFQTVNFIVDDARLHWATAWRVNHQHQGLRA